MEEIIKYLEQLNIKDKNKVIQELILQRRKEIIGLISQNNVYSKNNDIANIDITRQKIKQKKSEILLLQNLQEEIRVSNNESKKVKKSSEEPILSQKDLKILKKYMNEDYIKELTDFCDIEIPLLEHLLNIKQKYVIKKKLINQKLKSIRKSISILNDLESDESKNLINEYQKNKKIKKVLTKIIIYLNKLIKIEFKKRNSLNRKEKRLIETLFAEKVQFKDKQQTKDYTSDELYSTYYQLVFNDKNMDEITELLEKHPDLYLLQKNKKFFYELILDKYANTLLNKNYVKDSEKSKKNLEELEYYKNLITKYLAYSFESDKTIITDLTIKKIERIIIIFNKNNIYMDKSNEILNQIKYFQEIIHLGNSKNDDSIKEINNEYIFSIDSDGTKIIEDALSIKKENNNYYINFYIPDLASFIPKDSILEKKALDRYKNNKYAFQTDVIKFFKLKQGIKKRVIGYHFVYDNKGNLKDLKIEKNIIKLYNSYTFEKFNKLFLENNANALNLKEIFELISNKSIEDINYSSSAILSYLIQIAGINLGKYLGTKNITCIYKDISNGEAHLIWKDNDYVEFTSPIRSYISFQNQRIMFGEHVKDLYEKCDVINQKVKKINN